MLAVNNLSGFNTTKSKYPKQPPNYQPFGETNDLLVPKNGTTAAASNVLIGNIGNAFDSPSTLLTIQDYSSIANLSICPTGQRQVMQFIHETGTPPGFEEAGSDNVYFWLGQNEGVSSLGGPAADEFSTLYMSHWFNMYGNGTNYEGHIKFGYFGVANNNQNGSGGGPTQLFIIFENVDSSGGDPYTATKFTISLNNQAKPGQIQYDQNMNLWKNVQVGHWHHMENVMLLGTDSNADGTWLCWLDGVQVAGFSPSLGNGVTFINSTWAGQGGNGDAGFFGWQFSPWWQGGGANNKTRNDYIYFGHSFISGIYLRAHT